jgi:hypothetical protein
MCKAAQGESLISSGWTGVSSMDDQPSLGQFIWLVRRELQWAQEGDRDQPLRFDVDSIALDLVVEATTTKKGGGGLDLKVMGVGLSADGGAEAARKHANTIHVVLSPAGTALAVSHLYKMRRRELAERRHLRLPSPLDRWLTVYRRSGRRCWAVVITHGSQRWQAFCPPNRWLTVLRTDPPLLAAGVGGRALPMFDKQLVNRDVSGTLVGHASCSRCQVGADGAGTGESGSRVWCAPHEGGFRGRRSRRDPARASGFPGSAGDRRVARIRFG